MTMLGILIVCLALGGYVHETESAFLNVDTFFNRNGNLATITWAPQVTSLATLTQALQGPAMMLEANVIMEDYNTTTGIVSAVVIEQVGNVSDLSLHSLLNFVETHNFGPGNITRKGVRLNFRNLHVIEQTLLPLLYRIPRLNYPVWFDANIQQGPGNSSLNFIDARYFLDLMVGFRTATLSLSWTLPLPGNAVLPLPNALIDNMVNALNGNGVDQVITFSVRADIAAQSLGQLQNLVNRVPRSTLTIWGTAAQFNQITINNVRTLLINIGVNRTILIVPDATRTTLISNLPGSGVIASVSVICLVLSLLINLA